MTTAFNAIVTAMVAALSAATAVSPNIFRARLRPMAEQHTTAVVVRLQDAQPQRFAIAGAPVDFDTTIAVECYARTSTTTADVAVDALVEAVYAKLAADTTLGGLVGDIFMQSANWDFDADGEQTACATLTFKVVHRTANLTIT